MYWWSMCVCKGMRVCVTALLHWQAVTIPWAFCGLTLWSWLRPYCCIRRVPRQLECIIAKYPNCSGTIGVT